MTSLNPVYTVGEQIAEAVRFHQGAAEGGRRPSAVEMLELVGHPRAEPHGQRATPTSSPAACASGSMIAMALSCDPKLLIADEPTTALDVTIQAQILELMSELQNELAMSMLLITHDLGVVAEICDEVVVMYAGRVVEQGRRADAVRPPQHPYTEACCSRSRAWDDPDGRCASSLARVPSRTTGPGGCRFRPRCDYAFDRCGEQPPLLPVEAQASACWLCEGRRTPVTRERATA